MNRPIFLVGMMGAGKTTYGRQLANKLNRSFLDSDNEIERSTGLKIMDIFQTKGELHFRDLERNFIHQSTFKDEVVACGGGLPCYSDLILTLRKMGQVVYLQASPAFLFSRLVRSKTPRPLLMNLTEDELHNYLESKTREREIYYLMADEVIQAMN
jgi:shikimate kinase